MAAELWVVVVVSLMAVSFMWGYGAGERAERFKNRYRK